MGDLKRFSCTCGYSEELAIGVGIKAIRDEYIQEAFPDRVDEIKSGREAGTIQSAIVAKRLGVCLSCRKLVTVTCLEIAYSDGHQEIVKQGCPDCKSAVTTMDPDSPIECPSCGSIMTVEDIGNWD